MSNEGGYGGRSRRSGEGSGPRHVIAGWEAPGPVAVRRAKPVLLEPVMAVAVVVVSHVRCSITAMATKHPRIGVVADPELRAAMAATRSCLDPTDTRSSAGHVRRLALLGARALLEGDEAGSRIQSDYEQLLRRPGVRPATSHRRDFPWLDADPVDESNSMSAALEWVRGGR